MRAGFILLRSGGAGSQAGVLSSRNHSVRTRSPSDRDRMIPDCNVPAAALGDRLLSRSPVDERRGPKYFFSLRARKVVRPLRGERYAVSMRLMFSANLERRVVQRVHASNVILQRARLWIAINRYLRADGAGSSGSVLPAGLRPSHR
jgi:hypothetical protein